MRRNRSFARWLEKQKNKYLKRTVLGEHTEVRVELPKVSALRLHSETSVMEICSDNRTMRMLRELEDSGVYPAPVRVGGRLYYTDHDLANLKRLIAVYTPGFSRLPDTRRKAALYRHNRDRAIKAESLDT